MNAQEAVTLLEKLFQDWLVEQPLFKTSQEAALFIENRIQGIDISPWTLQQFENALLNKIRVHNAEKGLSP